MTVDLVHWGQIVTLLMIAIALGMDAFSLGIGMGMQGLRKRQILQISLMIGLFHVIMPLIGLYMGRYLFHFIGNIAAIVGGGVLCLLGAHMLWTAIVGGEKPPYKAIKGMGMILFALSVSVDALTVGLSLGLFAADTIIAVTMFGIIGGFMAGLGLSLGKQVGKWVGGYGEAFGGIILFSLGITFIF